MTDPGLRHAVCPECHTHQQVTDEGRLVIHSPANALPESTTLPICPGTGDYPNRAVATSRYDVTSNFASCPAATGEPANLDALNGCRDFPDGAHRCAGGRRHTDTHHTCTCGATWISSSGTIQDHVDQLNRYASDSAHNPKG